MYHLRLRKGLKNSSFLFKKIFFTYPNWGDAMNILITGARSGIGLDVALALEKRGHFVYLTTHTMRQAETLKKELSSSLILCFPLDITKEEEREKVKDLEIDCLICHAGIGEGGSILDLPMEKIRNNFEVNFFGTFSLIKAFLSNLVYKEHAKIIITSSVAGIVSIPFLGSYCATKAAISSLTKALRKELFLANAKVQVSLIEPGIYHTGFNDVMLDNKNPYLEQSIYFKENHKEISIVMKRLFHLFGKDKNSSIVKQFVKAVERTKPKKVYRAPFSTRILVKIYLLLFG